MLDESSKVTLVVDKLLGLVVDDVGADLVKEARVVRNNQGSDVGVGLEVLLEPLDVGNIKMVGRFIEKEDIGAHQHGSGQGELHLPTTRQRADLLRLATLGTRRETNLLENGHDSVLAFGLELGVLQAVVENGKISILTLVVLDEAGADLILRRESLELAVGNGTHKSGLSGTVSATETVAVALEKTKVGVRKQKHTTVTKRESGIDNFNLAILKRWRSTKLALILGDVVLVDSLGDSLGLAVLHKGGHVGGNVASDAHELAVSGILGNHGGNVRLGQSPDIGIASHLEKTAVCLCLLFQDLDDLFRNSAIRLRVVTASLLTHGLLDNVEGSLGNLTNLGKRGSVADSLGTGEKLGEESSGLDRIVDKLGQVLDDNDGLTGNFLRSAGAVERALEERGEDGENGGGDNGHESGLRKGVDSLLQT